jgi:hypothetical protein
VALLSKVSHFFNSLLSLLVCLLVKVDDYRLVSSFRELNHVLLDHSSLIGVVLLCNQVALYVHRHVIPNERGAG